MVYAEFLACVGVVNKGISLVSDVAEDLAKDGAIKFIKSVFEESSSPEDLKKNHHLLKVVRKAMLIATVEMKDSLADEMRLASHNKVDEKQSLAFIDRLTTWLKKELKDINDLKGSHVFPMPAYDEIHLLIAGGDDSIEAKQTLSINASDAWIAEVQHGLAEDLPPLALRYFTEGWNNSKGHWEWFPIVCFWFTNLLASKGMELANAKFNNRLQSDIATDLKSVLAKFSAQLPDANYLILRLGDFESKIEEGFKTTHEKQDLTLDEVYFLRQRILSMEALLSKLLQQEDRSTEVLSKIIKVETELHETREKLRQSGIELEEEKAKRLELQKQLNEEKQPLKLQAAEAISKRHYEQAKVLLQRSIDERSIRLADDYYQLGKVCVLNLQFKDALTNYEQAIILQPSFVGCLIDMGNICAELGFFDRALGYYNTVASIKEDDEERQADCNVNIGIIYDQKGLSKEAIKKFLRARDIYVKIHSEANNKVAACYNNLSASYRKIGLLDDALESIDKAISIRTQLHGDSNIRVANSYVNKGNILRAMGRLSDAILMHQKARNIFIEVFGENDPHVATANNNLGVAISYTEQYEMSLTYYEKALAIFRDIYGDNHYQVASTYNNLGLYYAKIGSNDLALEFYNKSLDIRLATYGETHSFVAESLGNIGNAFREMKEYDEALGKYDVALKILTALYGQNHASVARSYYNKSIALFYKGEKDEAIVSARSSFHIFRDVLGETHMDTQNAKSNYDKFCSS